MSTASKEHICFYDRTIHFQDKADGESTSVIMINGNFHITAYPNGGDEYEDAEAAIDARLVDPERGFGPMDSDAQIELQAFYRDLTEPVAEMYKAFEGSRHELNFMNYGFREPFEPFIYIDHAESYVKSNRSLKELITALPHVCNLLYGKTSTLLFFKGGDNFHFKKLSFLDLYYKELPEGYRCVRLSDDTVEGWPDFNKSVFQKIM